MSKLSRTAPHPVSSIYTCEAPGCGKQVSDVDVVSYILVLALPGKNGVIPTLGCAAEQHYGCCEEHAWQAVAACREEHLQPAHQVAHAETEADPEKMVVVQHLRDTHHQRAAWVARSLPAPEAAPAESA